MKPEEYYDRKWRERGGTATFTDRILERAILRSLREHGVLPNGTNRILELGCGAGRLSAQLARFGMVTAVDSAPETIRENQDRYTDVAFEVGDASVPLTCPDPFDVVVAKEVVEHIRYDRQRQFITNAFEALRPGGIFIMTTPNKEANERLGVVGRQPVEDWLTIDQASDLMQEQFEAVEVYTQVFTIPNRVLDAAWKRLFYPVNVTLVQHLVRRTRLGKHTVLVGRRADGASST